jgi:hypothetical protein
MRHQILYRDAKTGKLLYSTDWSENYRGKEREKNKTKQTDNSVGRSHSIGNVDKRNNDTKTTMVTH